MTAHGIFIAGTDTGVGKTRVSVALVQALRQRGIAASGMKPIATGTEPSVGTGGANASSANTGGAGTGSCTGTANTGGAGGIADPALNEDVALIRAASGGGAVEDLNPYSFDWAVSPHLAAHRAGVVIDTAWIQAAYRRLTQRYEAIVVEGTGGWMAPIDERRTMADVAATLALPVVLVVGLRLGCLNHALLTAGAIRASGLPFAGWIGSVLEPDMAALAENVATLRARLPTPQLALLLHATDRRQDSACVAAAAATLFV